jgi:YMGG-like Gly-zipper
MKPVLLCLPVFALSLAACTPAQQTTALGAVGGAAVGAAVSSDEDRDKGALVGAVVGGAAATLLGPASTSGNCRYRDAYGREYIAAC